MLPQNLENQHGNDSDDAPIPFDSPDHAGPSSPKRSNRQGSIMQQLDLQDVQEMTVNMTFIMEDTEQFKETSKSESEDDVDMYEEYITEDDQDEESTGGDSTGSVETTPENSQPDTWIRDQFRTYCAHAKKNFAPFTAEEITTIRLLHLLNAKNTPMNAYEPVMLWHLRESKRLYDHQGLGDCGQYIGRKAMIQKLIKRYNFENKMPKQKTIKLPVSGTVVKITCHDTKATIQRLLTDPRILSQDYMFWNDDPLAPPPEEVEYIEDLNTGAAFIDTYFELIDAHGREQLMPVVIYTDGTAVSHFHDMEIIQVNIALGTMTRQARTKPHCWAPLGYIEKIHEQGGKGTDILTEANHVATQEFVEIKEDSDDDVQECGGVGNKNDQDFHAMMGVILQEFVELQEGGFLWDHHDPGTGHDTPNIHYRIFVPFMKVDGKEADLCCAKYGQRSSTQHICRKCHIPLQEADDHLANYPKKTVQEIKDLVDAADFEGLKAISQTYLKNAFYNLRFSVGNDCGIHGSCPSELLHAFLLGTFKYLRDIFFELIGRTSDGAQMINALSKIYGKTFTRQSDRAMPNTAFSRGIQAGKLMAKDYRGVLLIMLAIVRSTKGRSILKKNKNFQLDSDLDDWILLIELMLEWESFLNEPRMEVKTVKRLAKKHRYIMYIMRKVAQRRKGMGLKLLKFHMILHIWEDILELGVPLEYDTSANESMHKPSKKASRMTQKAADTFNFQTATRLVEFALLDLAMAEIDHGRVPWTYFDRVETPISESEDAEDGPVKTGESEILVFTDPETGEGQFSMVTRSKFAEKTRWNTEVIDFLIGLQAKIEEIPAATVQVYTCHERKGQKFRGHPNFRGKGPWRDWVWMNWGQGYGLIASQIWCFVVIDAIPTGQRSQHYGGIPLTDGVYAVVENSFNDNEEDDNNSELMTPIFKEIELDANGKIQKRTFYLADTEGFADPACVIPDIGGPSNRYFVVKPRNQWADLFNKWVNDPHSLDQMDVLDTVEEEDDVMEILEEDRPMPAIKPRKRTKNAQH